MKPQRFEIINQRIRDAFLEKKALYNGPHVKTTSKKYW